MKTTLNQIKALNPDKGQFLNLLSYQAKTTPDDVEFPVTDILNATNLKFAVQTIEALNSKFEIATDETLDREIEFQKSIWNLWKEKFSDKEFSALCSDNAFGFNHTATQRCVFQGLNLIEDRFERQQTESIIAAKFLQYFKA